jgi:hypothetical protein
VEEFPPFSYSDLVCGATYRPRLYQFAQWCPEVRAVVQLLISANVAQHGRIPLESSLREQCVGASGERLARDVTSRERPVTTNRRLHARGCGGVPSLLVLCSSLYRHLTAVSTSICHCGAYGRVVHRWKALFASNALVRVASG